MALSAFTEKTKKPTPNELTQTLGRSFTHWEDLIGHFSSEYSPLDESWSFAGANWGWALKFKQKKRMVAAMTPCEKHFLVGFAFSDTAVDAAYKCGLPDSILTVIENAPQYAEGRAVRVEVRNKVDREVVKKLASIRMAGLEATRE